jgi:GT2 family glycosyltransferase
MYQITASIVLFKNNREKLAKAISSFLQTALHVKLYLIDNSPSDSLRSISYDPRVEYIFNNKNIGFGKGHNIAMKKSLSESTYHLVLNPDIYFNEGVLETLFDYMNKNEDVGHIMPKVLYPNNEVQYLCKLLPKPIDLLGRRYFGNSKWSEKRNHLFELKDSGYNKIMNIPFLSGCFMFLRTEALKKVGLFDDKIFMYGEDIDLTRRMHLQYKTIFYPQVHVYHYYAKGSYKNFKLMLYNIHGTCIYFNKWGWLFDQDRDMINQEVVKKYISAV